jgi:hypothetical protein
MSVSKVEGNEYFFVAKTQFYISLRQDLGIAGKDQYISNRYIAAGVDMLCRYSVIRLEAKRITL